MKKYIVALDVTTRFHRPDIGLFHHSEKHRRHVWRGEETDDIARLTELVNEALECARQMDQVSMVVGVYPVESEAHVEPVKEQEIAVEPVSVPVPVPAPVPVQSEIFPVEQPKRRRRFVQ